MTKETPVFTRFRGFSGRAPRMAQIVQQFPLLPQSCGIALSLVLMFAAFPAPAQEKALTEKEKIEALIKHVEELKDAKFVRNNAEYDAKTAARFLRGKWEANSASIKTAKDFIEKAASVSSTTGKPYLIRFKDGKEMKSGDYLLEELKKLEKSPQGNRTP